MVESKGFSFCPLGLPLVEPVLGPCVCVCVCVWCVCDFIISSCKMYVKLKALDKYSTILTYGCAGHAEDSSEWPVLYFTYHNISNFMRYFLHPLLFMCIMLVDMSIHNYCRVITVISCDFSDFTTF